MEMITPIGTRKFTSGGEKMEMTTPVITTRIAVVKVKEQKKVIVKRIVDQDSAEKTHLSQERPGMDSDDSYGMLDINNDLNESPPGQNGSHFERRAVPPPLPNKCDWEIDPFELDFSNSAMIRKSRGGIHDFSDSQFGRVFAFGESRGLAIANMVLGLKEIQIRREIRTYVDYTIDLLQIGWIVELQ